MAKYSVYFKYVDSRGKLRNDHVTLDASNQTDAKRRVIRGEKPKLIAVNRIVKK